MFWVTHLQNEAASFPVRQPSFYGKRSPILDESPGDLSEAASSDALKSNMHDLFRVKSNSNPGKTF